MRFEQLTVLEVSEFLKQKSVLIDYTNWKGNRRWRRVMPIGISWDVSPYHQDRGFSLFLKAIDIDDCVSRDFLIKDIHDIQLVEENRLDAEPRVQKKSTLEFKQNLAKGFDCVQKLIKRDI